MALSFTCIYCFKSNIFWWSFTTNQLDWCWFLDVNSCDFYFTIFYTCEINCCLCCFAWSTFWYYFFNFLFYSSNFLWIYVSSTDYSNNFYYIKKYGYYVKSNLCWPFFLNIFNKKWTLTTFLIIFFSFHHYIRNRIL
jgi:hypothetical protein